MANSVKKFNIKNGVGSIRRIHFLLWVLTNYYRFLLLTKSRTRLKIDWIEKEQKDWRESLSYFLPYPYELEKNFYFLEI